MPTIRADDPKPDNISEADFVSGPWQVMAVLGQLLDAGGWLTSRELGERAGLDRNQVRRICRTLEVVGWVRRESHDGSDFWTLGPELPRIGMAYQRQLQKQAEQLRADFDRAAGI